MVLIRVAWRNLWRHGRRTMITSLAMAVGVALCMATFAYSDGFFEQLFDSVVRQEVGHVQIHNSEYIEYPQLHFTLDDAEARLASLEAVDETRGVAGRLRGYALVSGEGEAKGALMLGVDPAREGTVSRLPERVIDGRWLEAQGEVVLGKKLARDLNVGVGEEVFAVTQAADGSLGNDLYSVVGVVRGASGTVLMHLTDAQDLLVLPNQVHEISILGGGPDHVPELKVAVSAVAAAEGVSVRTWSEVQPDMANALALTDANALVMVGIVFSVAALGVLNTMLMSVFERTREFGVIRAIGLRPRHVVAMVVYEALLLGVIACGVGLVMGGFLDMLLVVYGLDMTSVMEDGFELGGVTIDPIIRGVVKPRGIIVTVFAVLTVSVMSSLWPAWRASRLRPVEAMREG